MRGFAEPHTGHRRLAHWRSLATAVIAVLAFLQAVAAPAQPSQGSSDSSAWAIVVAGLRERGFDVGLARATGGSERTWLLPGDGLSPSGSLLDACAAHVERGGRLILVADGTKAGRDFANTVLRALHVGIRVEAEPPGRDEYVPLLEHPSCAGWSRLRGRRTATLSVTPPARGLVGASPRQVVVAVDRPAAATCGMPGCDVVVLADPALLRMDGSEVTADVLAWARGLFEWRGASP